MGVGGGAEEQQGYGCGWCMVVLAIPVKKTCVEVIFLLAPTRMFIKNQHYFYKLLTCRQHVADTTSQD